MSGTGGHDDGGMWIENFLGRVQFAEFGKKGVARGEGPGRMNERSRLATDFPFYSGGGGSSSAENKNNSNTMTDTTKKKSSRDNSMDKIKATDTLPAAQTQPPEDSVGGNGGGGGELGDEGKTQENEEEEEDQRYPSASSSENESFPLMTAPFISESHPHPEYVRFHSSLFLSLLSCVVCRRLLFEHNYCIFTNLSCRHDIQDLTHPTL